MRAVAQNGLTAKQYGAVWVTRCIVLAELVVCLFALRACSKVMQVKGTRRTIFWGIRFYGITGERHASIRSCSASFAR